jgi:hypothetical protein
MFRINEHGKKVDNSALFLLSKKYDTDLLMFINSIKRSAVQPTECHKIFGSISNHLRRIFTQNIDGLELLVPKLFSCSFLSGTSGKFGYFNMLSTYWSSRPASRKYQRINLSFFSSCWIYDGACR